MENKRVLANEIIPVQAMKPPTALFDFYEIDWFYDLGYGIYLSGEECLKLIDWWYNKGGKEEYERGH